MAGIRREHIEAWLVDLAREGKAAATLSVYYRSLQPFFAWAQSEGEIGASPMERMRPPLVPEQPVAVLTGRIAAAAPRFRGYAGSYWPPRVSDEGGTHRLRHLSSGAQ